MGKKKHGMVVTDDTGDTPPANAQRKYTYVGPPYTEGGGLTFGKHKLTPAQLDDEGVEELLSKHPDLIRWYLVDYVE